MRTVLILIVVVSLAVLLHLALTPGPVDPAAWQPPTPPQMRDALEPNTLLRRAEHLGAGAFDGPEDVAVDQEGRVYGGTANGEIRRIDANGEVDVFADTDGRPLGMQFDGQGRLVVADAFRGLLRIDKDGNIEELSTEAGGVPLNFTNDLDIAADGTIYFSDASTRFQQTEYLYDLLEARPHGRLLRYSPESGETEVLLEDLYFANGVALSQDEDYVLVNETYRYQITRYWLAGPDAGSSEIFIENLPGFPDNLSRAPDGSYWLALFTVRSTEMDALHPFPALKQFLARLPENFWPQPEPWGFVAQLDQDGNIIRSLQDPGGEHLFAITSARQYNDVLYLGSLYNDRIGVLPLGVVTD